MRLRPTRVTSLSTCFPTPSFIRSHGDGLGILADRECYHLRHRCSAAAGIYPLRPVRLAIRVPVRDELEPANRDPRRSGRVKRGIRGGAAVLGHDLHRRPHCDDSCPSAGADVGDLFPPIPPPQGEWKRGGVGTGGAVRANEGGRRSSKKKKQTQK